LEDWRRHYTEDRPHIAIGYNVMIAMHYPDGAPARYRETDGKIQLPAVQGWVAVRKGGNLDIGRRSVGGQV
jgi:hypothetical protein